MATLALLRAFLALAVIGAGMGLGDVKLAGLMLGGVVGATLLISRKATRGAEFAYGPPLMAGAVLAIVALPVG